MAERGSLKVARKEFANGLRDGEMGVESLAPDEGFGMEWYDRGLMVGSAAPRVRELEDTVKKQGAELAKLREVVAVALGLAGATE